MKLNVLGEIYAVKREPIEKQGLMGLCDPNTKTITIAKELVGEEYWSTLIHEMVHARDFELGFDQVLSAQAMEVNAETMAKVLMKNFALRFKK